MQVVIYYSWQHPTRYKRSVVADLGIVLSAIQNVLKNLLHIYWYKITIVHKVHKQNYAYRAGFRQWCMDSMTGDSVLSRRIVLYSECVFHLSGFENTKISGFGAQKTQKNLNNKCYPVENNGLKFCAGHCCGQSIFHW